MAWEEESIETGVDFEEVGGSKNKIKIIVIILVVLGLAFAVWHFKDKLFGDKEKNKASETSEKSTSGDEAGDDEEDGDGEEGGTAATGYRVNLEKFTINLSGSGSSHFLVTTIVLEVTTSALKQSMENPDDQDLNMIKTRDAINGLLMQKTYSEVRDKDAAKEIANALRTKLSNGLLSKGKVQKVYFSEFLVD